jgi:hypothetical protein
MPCIELRARDIACSIEIERWRIVLLHQIARQFFVFGGLHVESCLLFSKGKCYVLVASRRNICLLEKGQKPPMPGLFFRLQKQLSVGATVASYPSASITAPGIRSPQNDSKTDSDYEQISCLFETSLTHGI